MPDRRDESRTWPDARPVPARNTTPTFELPAHSHVAHGQSQPSVVALIATLTTLVAGDAMTVFSGAIAADDYTWHQVTSLDDTTGYVVGEYLRLPVAPAFAAGDVAVVNTDVVNVRDAATVSGGALTTIVTGETMTVLDGPIGADGYTWFQVVTADGTTGWVAGEYLAFA